MTILVNKIVLRKIILRKTKLLFVAAALMFKNLLFTFLILVSPYVGTKVFLIKFLY